MDKDQSLKTFKMSLVQDVMERQAALKKKSRKDKLLE